jgi:hypothetical protein
MQVQVSPPFEAWARRGTAVPGAQGGSACPPTGRGPSSVRTRVAAAGCRVAERQLMLRDEAQRLDFPSPLFVNPLLQRMTACHLSFRRTADLGVEGCRGGGLAGNNQNAAWGKVARRAAFVGVVAFLLLFWAAAGWAVNAMVGAVALGAAQPFTL